MFVLLITGKELPIWNGMMFLPVSTAVIELVSVISMAIVKLRDRLFLRHVAA
jgi:hypothetical protein